MEDRKSEATFNREPEIHCLFEHTTRTWQYIVACPSTHRAVIIDPVLDHNPKKDGISTVAADNIVKLVQHYGYIIERILETHSHASAASAVWYLRSQLRDMGHEPRIAIGRSTEGIRRLFQRKYGMYDPGFTGAFDGSFSDADSFRIGELTMHCMQLPGHTPDQIGFMCGRSVFAGGAIPNIDAAGSRPEAVPCTESAKQQYIASAERLLSLPLDFRIYKGHDELELPVGSPSGEQDNVVLTPFATVQQYRERGVRGVMGAADANVVMSGVQRPRDRGRTLSFNIKSARRAAYIAPIAELSVE
ncbi:hypothetical protein BAUCODRAFT_147096 [Baudoinia panamericana UAMH 10762]|uniref:Metallo-beta-lactamase domain-containing protein n=1 Tax=Baudoinia panamericana (strain UAMH 10762) TaxID=717646 RepID=M2MJM0_BAUPA|nr:uncharacterized protein BAUCODRAFT_147096 [Baudoinia panamericana UAMH 10762]EMC96896.1 hypothetical protein BAUCODRAFT_147096 [Baudoinia panamericana UAMH 10762]